MACLSGHSVVFLTVFMLRADVAVVLTWRSDVAVVGISKGGCEDIVCKFLTLLGLV